MKPLQHQYIARETGKVNDEVLFQDRAVLFLYSHARENMSLVFRLLTGARASKVLGYLNYDSVLTGACREFVRRHHIDTGECLDDARSFNTLRKLFERKIRYWECRPLPRVPQAIVSPADARVLVGSLATGSPLFIKDKFFDYEELLARDKTRWLDTFRNGDCAIFRLTPEKYHFNHTPVAGTVVDIYEIRGAYHSCNPGAVVSMVTPYSKNTRVVTVIDTDVDGGSRIGLVAMVEVVALMIGDIVQCYSDVRYERPQMLKAGMFLHKGRPKSLFRPGSSTTILMFEKGRVRFADDLRRNQTHSGAHSRFSLPFAQTMIETDIKVRSLLALPLRASCPQGDSYA